MKILHVYDEFPKTYQHYLLEPLKQFRQFEYSRVLTFEHCEEADHVVISERGMDMFQRLLFKLGLTKYKNSFEKVAYQFDIVHIHHSYLFPKLIPLLTKRKSKTKFIITLRGADTYLKPWIDNRWKKFYSESGNQIDRFVVVSNHQKDYLSSRWNIHPGRIDVVPVSMTLKPLTLSKRAAPESELKIISSFRFTWEKNIEGNLRVIKVLKERGVNVKYTICGDGLDIGMVYYFIDRYNLHDIVKLEGKVNPEEYMCILSHHNIYLQLSFSEALSASVIEAQGLGLPAIISDADGIPESILDKKTGFAVKDYNYEEAADKLMMLFEDKNRYELFSQAAILNVKENFSVEREIHRLKIIYDKVMINEQLSSSI